MSKYGQFCPVAKALDVLGDHWTLLIVRNMLCGMAHFNDLERGLPGISRALLAQRLRRLQQAGVIEKRLGAAGRNSTEYHLTPAGRELQAVIGALIMWGEAWACGEPEPDELDAALLMWLMRSDVQSDRLPQKLVVVQYNFRGKTTATYWLILTMADVSLCVTDPGYGIDVMVTADLATYYELWYGRISYREAIHDYGVEVEGMPQLVRAFPDWFAWRIATGIGAARTARTMQPPTQLLEVGPMDATR